MWIRVRVSFKTWRGVFSEISQFCISGGGFLQKIQGIFGLIYVVYYQTIQSEQTQISLLPNIFNADGSKKGLKQKRSAISEITTLKIIPSVRCSALRIAQKPKYKFLQK